MSEALRAGNGRFSEKPYREPETYEAYQERFEERDLRVPDLRWRVESAARHERLAKATRGSFPVLLIGDRPFWSKGWRGCHFNCWRPVDDWSLPMVERITVKDGVITRGFYCR